MNATPDDVVPKFKLTLKRAPAPEQTQYIALEKWRALFYRLGLVGEYPNENIGYGNLSSRVHKKSFIITGSQTGHLPHLQAHHYTKVIDCDLKKGSLTAEGLIPPSPESLLHYEIYEANSAIQSVFHVHHQKLWEMLSHEKPDLIDESKNSGISITAHPADGIFSYATTAEEAGKNLLDLYRKLGVRQ